MVVMFTCVYWTTVKCSTEFIMVPYLIYYLKCSILIITLLIEGYVREEARVIYNFLSIHIFQINERGKARRGALPNPI